jgi:hypothetical protein
MYRLNIRDKNDQTNNIDIHKMHNANLPCFFWKSTVKRGPTPLLSEKGSQNTVKLRIFMMCVKLKVQNYLERLRAQQCRQHKEGSHAFPSTRSSFSDHTSGLRLKMNELQGLTANTMTMR